MSDLHPATPLGSPPASGPVQPEAPTPGKAAYEAYLPLAYDTCDNSPWDERDPRDRDAWEAAAGAAAFRWHQLEAERDHYRDLLAREDADFEPRLAVLDSVIAERDRYRAALERIRGDSHLHGYGWPQHVARKALEARDA